MVNNMTIIPCLNLLLISALLLLSGCNQPKSSKQPLKTHQVTEETVHNTLYFTGTIQPCQTYSLTTPMDATIETMHYHYGQTVKQNTIVFTLNSPQLQKLYNEALTDYLKSKEAHTMAQTKFAGTKDLWEAGLLSKNHYLNEQSNLNNSRVSFMQARHKLSAMLETIDEHESDETLASLSFASFDKVSNAFNTKHSFIRLMSKHEGILLYPPKSGEDKNTCLTVGSAVKAGQVLGLIGDLSGIRIDIDIPEVDIGKIKVGMPAFIRNVAFPKDILKGHVSAINAQATSGSQAALPSFTAMIEVKPLTPQQKKWVRAGMSASIEIPVDETQKLMIPIKAVKLQATKPSVEVLEHHGRLTTKHITTGTALADKVVVESGLNPGDVVIISENRHPS